MVLKENCLIRKLYSFRIFVNLFLKFSNLKKKILYPSDFFRKSFYIFNDFIQYMVLKENCLIRQLSSFRIFVNLFLKFSNLKKKILYPSDF